MNRKEEKVVTIYDWYTTIHPACSPYTPPECHRLSLAGKVLGHERFAADTQIITSAIVCVEGRIVKTESGTVYRLGEIDKKFRDWLRKNRPNWDWRKPITMVDERRE